MLNFRFNIFFLNFYLILGCCIFFLFNFHVSLVTFIKLLISTSMIVIRWLWIKLSSFFVHIFLLKVIFLVIPFILNYFRLIVAVFSESPVVIPGKAILICYVLQDIFRLLSAVLIPIIFIP